MSLATPDGAAAVRFASDAGGDIAARGFALSAAFHVGLIVVLVVGLPKLLPPPPEEAPIAVRLVTIAPQTRATHPNPDIPRPEAKPLLAKLEGPAPRPEPKPVPPKPSPAPPAAAAPPPKPPPEPKLTAKPPEAKPVEAPPPLPEPKPKPVETAALPQPTPAKPQEARPAARPQPPKPLEKPQPPVVRQEPKPQHKKYQEARFDALLKNLAAQDNDPTPDAPRQRPQRTAADAASSQPRAPLGSQMSASEIDLIRRQISRCWNIPAGARDAKDLVVEIRVALDRDGEVQQATIVDPSREASDPFFRAAAESARRAFYNPMCRPLHGLPPDKYDIWKDLVVTFNPKDVL